MQDGWIQDEGIDDRAHLVEIGGELDIASASQLKDLFALLIAGGKRELVVDLSEAEFIDSTTIGVLVRAVNQLEPLGGVMAVVCVKSELLKTFEIAALDQVVGLYPSRDEALAYVRAADARPAATG